MTDFKAMHVPGRPLVLCNIWDAGSAVAVAKANPLAIATGSWAVAKAQGYEDGQNMPFARFLDTVIQISDAISLPLTVDFEAGFAQTDKGLFENLQRLVAAGAIGINFEDRIIGDKMLQTREAQASKIKGLRGVEQNLFINARCDLMFDGSDLETQMARLPDLIDRAQAYADAGADGFFVPGVTDPALIEKICAASPLPVNVMRGDDTHSITTLAALGVARISHGPAPYIQAMLALTEQAKAMGRDLG
ncbi:isocitrate lyase/phosphoenolpyruvate mutase family protein [Ascidiaceihabitans sp.]|uniref:isocitrate lyase/PEP mutase family protein n=1 Tax=Ascidiaceihabitans sp. TaxID=1872644 RepID=UPI003299C3BD